MEILLNIKLFIINIIIIATNFFKVYTTDFINFLLDRNIIQTCIGILISGQVIIFAQTISESIINPILKRLSFTKNNFKNIKYNRFGINFEIGNIISNLITFLIISSIIFFIWNIATSPDIKFINDILHNFDIKINNHKNQIINKTNNDNIINNQIDEIIDNSMYDNNEII
jgi:large-conductance mechanosensitive channel